MIVTEITNVTKSTTIDFDIGTTLKTKLDNSLNDGFLTISHITQKEPYDIFDKIKITYYNDDLGITIDEYYYIGGDIVKQTSKNPLRYTHELQLIELTKKHERYYVGNKSFSRNKDGTSKYTLFAVLTILQQTVPFETTVNSLTREPIFKIKSSDNAILLSTEAPQLFFNKATLRDCIDEVLSVIDATYELDEDNFLNIKYFNDIKNTVNDVRNEDREEVFSNEYYATEMLSEVENEVYDVNGVQILSGLTRKEVVPNINLESLKTNKLLGDGYKSQFQAVSLSFRSDEIEIKSGNQKILLPENLKIEDIYDAYICIKGDSGSYRTYNFNKYLYEYAEYQTLRTISTVVLDYDPHKYNCVYYNLGGTAIEGWGQEYIVLGNVANNNMKYLAQSVISKAGDGALLQSGEYDSEVLDNINNYMFVINYKPVFPIVHIAAPQEKTDQINKFSQLYINQEESIISSKHFGNNLYGKTQRLGNSDLHITETITDLNYLKQIGDINSEGYVITEIEKVFYPQFIKVKYLYNKDFNKFSEFIGVNSVKRQYQITQQQTTNRNLRYTEYCIISPEKENDNITAVNDTLVYNDGVDVIIQTLLYSPGNNTGGAILISNEFDFDATILNNNTTSDSTKAIYMAIRRTGSQRSSILTFSMPDNIGAGDKVVTVDSDLRRENVTYKDQNGELDDVDIRFINYTDPNWGTFDKWQGDANNYPAIVFDNVDEGGEYTEYIGGIFRVKLDLADVLTFTYQLQYLPSSEEIVIGENFIDFNNLTLNLPGEYLYLYRSNSEFYKGRDNRVVKGDTIIKTGTEATYTDLITNYPPLTDTNDTTYDNEKIEVTDGSDAPREEDKTDDKIWEWDNDNLEWRNTQEIDLRMLDIATVDFNTQKMTFNDPSIISGYTSWGIGDQYGNLWLGVNQINGEYPIIRLDFKNKRDDIVYDY